MTSSQELELVTLYLKDFIGEVAELKNLEKTIEKHQSLYETDKKLHDTKLEYLKGLLQIYNQTDILGVINKTLDEIEALKADPKVSPETLAQKYESINRFVKGAIAVYVGLVKPFEEYLEYQIKESRKAKTAKVEEIKTKMTGISQFITGFKRGKTDPR